MESVKIGNATLGERGTGFIVLYNLFTQQAEKNLVTLRNKFNEIPDLAVIELVSEMLNNGEFSSFTTRQTFRRFCQVTYTNKHNMITGLDIQYDRTNKVYHVVARMVKSNEEINKRGEIVEKKVETPTETTETTETPTDTLNKKHEADIEALKSKHDRAVNNLDASLEAEQLKVDAEKQERVLNENKVRELEKTLSIIINAVNDTKVTRKELIKMVSNI